ncbi:MAG: response regulator transcription factor [Clostridium sp.]|uniref:response regulator transcription factor n=1 Tax=Clostridium sp. TaxID=1506 RepID=UPI002FC95D01
MAYKVLIIDDEEDIRNLIRIYLENEGYETTLASSGEDGINNIENGFYDLILLDIMMEGINGIETCIEIRKKTNTPIIFLTAKGSELDKLQGLSVGADDYISKPFSSLELLARVKAQIRRYRMYNNFENTNSDIIQISNLTIDKLTHTVKILDEDVKLTPTEYSLLLCLAENKGKVFSIENIYENVWKDKSPVSDTSIVVHITNLRQKIEEDPKNPKYIKTVWGVGYKI